MELSEYQACGDVVGYGKNELAEANRQLAEAKNNTPADLREQFRGGVRFNKTGYFWFWYLRN